MQKEMVTIREAARNDFELYMKIRLEVLTAVFGEIKNEELAELSQETREYLQSNEDHITYFAYQGERFVGCGTICFYRVLPVCCNANGKKGFIMNMYTRPAFRKRGIAKLILDRLVDEANQRGVREIHLDASDIGETVYRKYGFIASTSEMYFQGKSKEHS